MMHFKFAYLKLTAFYVLIIMVVSISFSVAFYKLSAKEIGRNLGPQSRIFQTIFGEEIERIRNEEIVYSKRNLKTSLLYYNLIILAAASIGGYFLARRTLDPIEESIENQKRFTADASHELRTPLAAMKTEIEVSLRDKNLSIEDAKALLKSNLEEVDKLENLSSTLLKLARNETGQLDFKKVDLGEVINQAVKKYQLLAKNKAIKINKRLGKAAIKGSKESLIELFSILIDNAIKYSPKNSKIELVLKKTTQHAIVRIKDNGIGIKAQELPYIFDRFYRADSSRSKEKTSGFGLGLSIAQQIAKLHGGSISVKSAPNKGSEFTVKL